MICCYKCGKTTSLLVQVITNAETNELIRKEFICLQCSNLFEKENESEI
jgi:DNA-directed RNA polymerase subunit RPC12/RpoP